MARQEKKSRMRMLPARVQLQQRDALTGSYPTNVRFSIDGRTGDYPVSYNDIYTVVFTSSNNYIPAVGFPVGNIWLNNSQSNDLTASIVTTGSIRSQIIDGLPFFHFTPGQDLTPFRDSNQPAVDGKSVENAFYAIGSAVEDVGEGFNSPLWSKNKIEIDLYNKSPRILGGRLSSTGLNDVYMAYYDHSNTEWNRIGSRRATTFYISQSLASPDGQGTVNYFKEKAVGWANSWNLGIAGYNQDAIHQLKVAQEFGFPYDTKYSLPKDSQMLYPLKDIIKQPFLVEKIVLEFTASFRSNDFSIYWGAGAIGCATNTFFILNQRDISTSKTISQNITLQTKAPGSYPSNYNPSYTATGSLIDILSYISLFTPGADPNIWYQNYNDSTERESVLGPAIEKNKNCAIILSTSSNFDDYKLGLWSGRYQVSATCVSPVKYVNNTSIPSTIISNNINIRSGSTSQITNIIPSGPGNRGNTNQLIDTRSYLNPAIGFKYESLFDSFLGTNSEINALSTVVNPYLLLPTDNLIFGWQAPYNGYFYEKQTADGVFIFNAGEILPSLTIHAGPSKVILYGSYIKEGKEYNDGTNQLLSSDSVHEVIE
jgi:hypothetical protein